QEEPAESHRLRNETAQRRDALFDRWPRRDGLCDLGGEAAAKLVPEGVVAPLIDLIIERALDVVAASRLAALTAQRKSALVIRIDQLWPDRRYVRQHAQPAERVDLFERRDRRLRNACA